MTSLHDRIAAEIDRLETLANATLEDVAANESNDPHWTYRPETMEVLDAETGVVIGSHGTSREEDLVYIATWDPARVLRGLAEDRDILTRHAPRAEPVQTPIGKLVVCRNCSDLYSDPVRVVGWPCYDALSLARRHGLSTEEAGDG
jgi:hypothetical protein